MTVGAWVWCAAAALVPAALFLLKGPLSALLRLSFRSGVGLGVLWLFDQVGTLLGIHLGLNLVNAVTIGALGVPGFGLLLMIRWILG